MFFKKKEIEGSAIAGRFEPTTTVTFLPRCPNCESPHPLASKPPIDSPTCLECGSPTYVGKTKEVPAALTGKGLKFASVLFNVGKYFRNLANKE